MARVDCDLQSPFWLRLRRGVCGVSMRVGARMLRDLTRRVCPNGAPQARSELCGAPRKRPDAGLPRRGRRLRVAFSLVTFFWRSKGKLLRRRAHTPASALNHPTRPLKKKDSCPAIPAEASPKYLIQNSH